ncbi:MAG: hydrogenase maturation nickel metallochaperone HypA [Bacteroidetes bacterium HGW-Bacteroidetes-21]|jgi:hydrogenase nickel incorporation protein HypA/HybF|nr:MAG: hydrogenase maturation nickel metallochaperone HypA [Bacteroidetes bacterium HGW-Bacteroidetes-21]
MHELSIVMNILDTVEEKAKEMNATMVHEIEMEVGILSGVEFDALDFAFENSPKPPLLSKVQFLMHKIKPVAKCSDCQLEFDTLEYATPCPGCKSIHTELIKGNELRIKSFKMD